MPARMKAAVFVEPGRIVLDEKPVPEVGPLDALVRVTTTTICGTDVHILKGEYPVRKGLTIGHEPVGVIEKLGSAVQGYRAPEATRRTAPERRTAGNRSAAGSSATPSTAARRNTSSCRTPWRTSLRSPMASPTSRC
jgi:alcohol dehydrogenase